MIRALYGSEKSIHSPLMIVYLLAYLIPTSAVLGLIWGGTWAWSTVVLVYVMIPVADQFLGDRYRRGVAVEFSDQSRSETLQNALLYLAVPVQFFLLYTLARCWSQTATLWERIGWILSVGLACGGLGITVAHELIHRRDRVSRALGRCLLLSVLYMHFAIEHLRGHHAYVGTARDAASAPSGMTVYRFVTEGIVRQWQSAWALETGRLRTRGQSPFSLQNEFLWMMGLQVGWLTMIAFGFGFVVSAVFVAVSIVAVLLLEVVNYIEHYGLRRRLDELGRPEPVRAHHSWNSDHFLSRCMLFELPRHTDHHMNAGRAFTSLKSVEGAPQLPAGYPTMVLVALVPPLWFRVMNPRIAAIDPK